jgi:hypothetical protein
MNQDATTIPDWKLERFILGELPAADLEAIRQQLASDDLLKSRLKTIEESDEALRVAHPVEPMVEGIEQRLDGKSQPQDRSKSAGWLWTALPVAAAVVLFLYPTVEQNALDGNRVKGGSPALFLYRKSSTGVEELHKGHRVFEHDLIQIKYQPGTHRYGVILSIDGRSAVTVHLPETGQSAAVLERRKADTLGFSYELDDAPAGERFYFVSSDTPFKVVRIRDALGSIGFHGADRNLDLPDTFTQYIFTLTKDPKNAK